MDPYAELMARIDRLCALARRPDADRALVGEINDALSEGYGRALATEQQLAESEERLVDLLLGGDERCAGELGALDAERRALASQAAGLRKQLARMHECFVVLNER